MEALWWLGDEHSLSYKSNIIQPHIRSPDDVKVKVSYSGVCGSDFHFMKDEMGKFSAKRDGVILGHEFSGTVVETGENASKRFKVGDRVCINPNECCGTCVWAKRNVPHFCALNKGVGIQVDGGWAQYCVAPESKVYQLPESVNQMQGALAEPYSCVLRGWKQLEPLDDKSTRILVQGGGIIGVLFCTILHFNGFKKVTVSEPNNERRKLCSNLNFGFTIVHPGTLDADLEGKDVDSLGYDIIIDCTGNAKAVERAFEIARRGAKICIFGCCPAGSKISVDPFQIYWKELTIVGSFINPFCFDEALSLMEKLSNGGYLDYDKLGIKTFDLNDYESAIQSLKLGKATKAIFKINE